MYGSLVVFLGAGLGGVLRHGLNTTLPKMVGTTFPIATMVANITGSLLMGLIVGYLAFKDGQMASQSVRLFLTTGLLGGYTTFSTFSLDFFFLMERGQHGLAALYVLVSVSLAFIGVFAGLMIMRAFS